MLDILIVGGGPAGLSAAIYARRAMKNVLVVEEGAYGGQITFATKVENYPGFKQISGLELGNLMKEQASSLGTTFRSGKVEHITKKDSIFEVTIDGEIIKSKSIIYASGASSGKLGLPNEEALIGAGVSYCATCDGAFFKGLDVAVVGGGNTAIEDALYLSNIANKVYLIHRRDEFRAEPVKLEELKSKSNITMLMNSQIKEILGKNNVEGIMVEQNGEKSNLVVSGLFVAIGRIPNTELISNQITLNDKGYIVSDENMKTNIDGFFVAGDVREKNIRQVTTAVSDGTIAGTNAARYVNRIQY